MSSTKNVESRDSEEKRFVDEIRTKYERESATKSAEQLDRLMEAFSRDLYSEPAHYALEFIQNTEDSAQDSKNLELLFTIQAGFLLVTNNGKPFDKDDVETICDIARSKKRAKLGYKGLGFKSVIAISERIEIHSGNWHFEFNKALHRKAQSQFRWIFIPHWIDRASIPLDSRFTNFVIHLQGAEESILKQMEQLTPRSLLFLDALSKIIVSDKTRPVTLINTMFKEAKRASKNSYRILLGWDKNGTEGRERWILVETKAGPIPQSALRDYKELRKEDVVSEPKVAVAFRVRDGRLIAIKDSDTVYAFLPTKETSGFPFLLHSNFLVTASRETLHRCSWNEYIRDNVPQTLLTAVEFFKHVRLFQSTFYEVMPLEDDTADDFYRKIARKFRDMAADSSIVLADDNRWLKPLDTYLPAKEAIRLLISSEDLGKLFCRNVRYVHQSVKGARAERFLRSIGVCTIGKSQVLSFLKNEDWLRHKPLAWFLKLYAYLEEEGLSAEELQSLRTVRILKDQKGDLCNPSEVFLPPKEHKEQILSLFGEDIRFLHRRLLPVAKGEQETERSQASAFLNRLDIPVADRRQLIESVIVPFFEGDKWQVASDEKRINYTIFVKEYLEGTTEKSQARAALVGRLKKCLRIKAKSGNWVLAEYAYLTKEFGIENDLELLLGRTTGIEFVSSEYLKGIENDDKVVRTWRDFLKELGVFDIPRLRFYSDPLQLNEHPQKDVSSLWEAYSGFLRQIGWQVQWSQSRHEIEGSSYLDGLDYALESGDEGRLRSFLSLIDRHFSYYEQRLNATYSYYYRFWNPRTVPSYWLWALQNTPCIPTTKGLRKPSEVYVLREEVKAVLGDFVPYLNCELKSQKLLTALGIHDKPTVADASSYLVYCRDSGIKHMATYEHLYRVLGESSECAQEALAMLPDDFIFAAEGDNWWSPKDCYWEDASRFFGTEKCYLKKYYAADTYTAMLNLGVKASPEPEDLVDYLTYLPTNTTRVSVELKQRLWQIYLALEEALKTGRGEDWAEQLDDIRLLTEKGVFELSPFVGDDRILYELFRDDLPFVWLPESWKRVEAFLGKVSLPLISHAVDVSIVVGKSGDHQVEVSAKELIHANLRFIRTLLKHKYPDQDFSDALSLLDGISIRCVDALTVEYFLRGGTLSPRKTKAAVAATYDRKNGCIWIVNLDVKGLSLAVTAALGGAGYEIRSEVMQLFGASSEKEKLDLWTLLNIPVPEEIPPLPAESVVSQEEAKAYVAAEDETELASRTLEEKIRREVASALGSQEGIEVTAEFGDETKIVQSATAMLQDISLSKPTDAVEVYQPPQESREVIRPPSIIVKPMAEASTKFHVVLQTIDREQVYITPGMEPVNVENVGRLRNLLRKAVEIMGGDPDCVKICITRQETDGRNIDGQLYFNVARNDSPYRWVVVAARELARNDSRSRHWYGHVKVMTTLLEKAIRRVHEIFPEEFLRLLDKPLPSNN